MGKEGREYENKYLLDDNGLYNQIIEDNEGRKKGKSKKIEYDF